MRLLGFGCPTTDKTIQNIPDNFFVENKINPDSAHSKSGEEINKIIEIFAGKKNHLLSF